MNAHFNTFRQPRALTEEELRKSAPSVFAVAAHVSRSERFKPIPTIEVIRALSAEGFSVVSATQSTSRDVGRRDFTKHMLRLRRLDDATKYQVGDTIVEALLKNANDGTSAYDLLLGLFRIACMNGMVCNIADLDSVKVRHSGDVQSKVIEGTYTVLAQAERALVAPAEWPKIELDRGEADAFAEAAHVLRFGDAAGDVTTPIEPSQLLIPRRHADAPRNLWTTFNVVQENSIRGGLSAMGTASNGQRRRFTSRAVTGIDQDVKLNKALWTLAERMAELKKV